MTFFEETKRIKECIFLSREVPVNRMHVKTARTVAEMMAARGKLPGVIGCGTFEWVWQLIEMQAAYCGTICEAVCRGGVPLRGVVGRYADICARFMGGQAFRKQQKLQKMCTF